MPELPSDGRSAPFLPRPERLPGMTSTPTSDGALLQAWRSGDQAAFGHLVARHEAALLRHARALLGRDGAVEDAVQEAFLKLARTPPELTEGAADGSEPDGREHALLAAWLHRVTRNLCMDALRTDTRRRAREERVAPPEALPPDPAVDAADTRAAVERSLERLPADQREVLVLRLLAERSYREIATITGRKIGTVGWLVSTGLKALARELAPLLGMAAGVTNGVVHPAATGGAARVAGAQAQAHSHGSGAR